tara:strand:- start:1800 stop:3266 length:1467 start_codon:yes stop_codon:yes gene_type:complete
VIIYNGGSCQPLDRIVLFPFDDHSVPLQTGLDLQLIPHRTYPAKPSRIVVPLGDPGTPDSRAVCYYGTVCRVGEELWMWYLGQDDRDDTWFQRICFARSTDGYHWEKPDLGLVSYHGDTHNNLVDLNQGSHHVQACVVFHDPDDPDPSRRFKMAYQCRHYNNHFAVAFSEDGLTWRDSANNPVGPHLEMAGGVRHNGVYVLSGQGGAHPRPTRQMVNHISYDFETWSEAFHIGLTRGNSHLDPHGTNVGPQVHLGVAMWDRGNVLLGVYGQWNGHHTNDRRFTHMDLGLTVSNDAIHHREPIHEFPFVSASQDGWYLMPEGNPSISKYPALIQGQGFENVGEETLFWYGPWPEQISDGVRVAAWKRDRLGYFCGYLRQGWQADLSHHFVSAPIDLQGKPARVSINAEGLGDHGQVSVEILDETLLPVEAYGREQATPIVAAGFDQTAEWGAVHDVRMAGSGKVRLRVHIEGVRPEDARVYAVYLDAVQ